VKLFTPAPPAQVCLDFVSRNLAAVIATDGYRHMTNSCPELQAEILQTIANTGGGAGGGGNADRGHGSGAGHRVLNTRPREGGPAGQDDGQLMRRVRPRLD